MNYTVTWMEESLSVRTAAVYPSPYHKNSLMEYVAFLLKEPGTLRIVSGKKVESAVVRPLSLQIAPVIENGEITVRLERPVKFSLEINGSAEDNLLVLAEEDRYGDFDKDGRGVLCFPPGVHKADLLTVEKDDTTVYLEEGAYVHGKLVLSHCSHVTVCGYGAVSMEQYPYEARPVYARCVDAIECRDVTIRDITILDSNDWSLRICGCEDVLVDNVKIIGCRGNSDGIDICGSRRVLVQNAFTRVWDDSLVVKALDTGDVEDVTFRRCILWNDFARPMEVGVELRADKVHRVKFQDIDVLHSPTGYPLMGIHHGDRALVSDILFEDIRIEDAPGAQLFDIRITPSYWNRDKQMGCIRDVTFRKIHMLGNPGLPLLMSDSRLQGYDEAHGIRNVAFEELCICGKTPRDVRALGLKHMDYAEGVRVVPAPGLPRMQMVETAVEITKPFRCRTDGYYEGEITLVLCNSCPEDLEKEVWLKISPEHLGEYGRDRQTVFLPAGEQRRIAYPVVLQPGKYVAALQSEDPEVAYAWQLIALDWNLKRLKTPDSRMEPLDSGLEQPESPDRSQERLELLNIEGSAVRGSVAVLEEQRNKPPYLRPLEFVNYWGDRLGGFLAWAEGKELVIDCPLLLRKDCTLILYTAVPPERQPGEVLFSVEETDFGQVPAILEGRRGPEAAPQLRCPLEITLVFRNQPRVDKIHTWEFARGDICVRIPLKELGITEGRTHFWMEAEIRLPETEQYRYPYTLFHSVTPLTAAHMYGNCILEAEA